MLINLLTTYRKGLVSTGLLVLLLSCTNKRREWSFHLVGTPFLAFRQLSVWRSIFWLEAHHY